MCNTSGSIKAEYLGWLWSETILLHNTCPHITNVVTQKFRSLNWETLQHPPYSPYLSPFDFHTFKESRKEVLERPTVFVGCRSAVNSFGLLPAAERQVLKKGYIQACEAVGWLPKGFVDFAWLAYQGCTVNSTAFKQKLFDNTRLRCKRENIAQN